MSAAVEAHVAAGGVVLSERPGPGRTLTALCESARVGLAAGLALAGRPVLVELEEVAGLARAADALGDLATVAERSGGAWSAPVVVRVPLRADDAIPALPAGLRVGVAAGESDAMIGEALRAGRPTVVFEADGAGESGAAGVPVVVRSGGHASLLACGAGVATAVEAAERLAAAGVEVDVVDLRGVDAGVGVAGESARKTGRVVVVGLSGAALARVLDVAFWRLEGPPVAVGAGASVDAVVATVNSVLEA